MATITLDSREQQLKLLFPPETQCTNLVHGDLLITNPNGKVIMVLERKTLADLSASIKDGRYKNQKKEMMDTYDRSSIYYIIEGPMDFNPSCDPVKKALISSVINTCIRDNIKIFFTRNVIDTFNLMSNIYEKINADPDKYTPNPNKQSNEEEVVLKKDKKLTKEDFFKRVLFQIPGVSYMIANELVSRYKSFKTFYEAFVCLDDDTEKLNVLKGIKVNQRAISKTTLNNIIQYIFYSEDGNTIQS